MIRKVVIVVLVLAALGTWALWAASWVAPQHIGQVSQNSIHIYNLKEGRLWFGIHRNRKPLAWDDRYTRQVHIPMWFHITRYRGQTAYRRYDGCIFLGSTTVVLAAYPAIAFIRGPLRRYRRRRRGLCVTCGYNLTGNESGRCPECATEIEPS